MCGKEGIWVKALVIVLTVASLASSSLGQKTNEAICAVQTSCGQCISASPHCTWCSDEGKVGCRLASWWSADDKCRNVSNPRSRQVTLKNNNISDTVQVSPQQFKISLRPGETVEFTVSVKPAENFPVDLYYLMDMSHSMGDDLSNLKKLGGELAEGLKQKTSELHLGFGTFVDKTVLPYVDVAHLKDQRCCRRAFPFINNLPLTPKSELFVEKVKNESISVNLDEPEGGLDALMQVVVCGDEIGWREDARRIVVMATDDTFHVAGDGKLGGAVIPHDGNCYLDRSGEGGRYREDVANRLDYPSIGQIKEKLTTRDIIPVFAVTDDYIELYNGLKTELTGAFTGVLQRDSGNVVSLIQGIYDEIVSSVTPVVPSHQGITVGVRAQCDVNATEGPEATECSNVRLGQEVKFTFNITAASCEDIRQLTQGIAIRFVGFGEVKLDVMPICDCECEDQPVANSTQCEGGSLVCGQCECLEGRFGRQCQCTQGNAENVDKCRPRNATADTSLCNGRGECSCGHCTCRENFDGEFCQCNRQACSRDNNGHICGGNERGECTCRSEDITSACLCQCQCMPGYTGDDCSCPLSLDTCKKQSDQSVCSDHGVCSCGRCLCNEGYLGSFCSIAVCPGQDCGSLNDSCTRNEDCARCYGFRTGPHAHNCSAACPPLVAGSGIVPEGIDRTDCPGTVDDCAFSFTVLHNEDNALYGIVVKPGKDCPDSFSYLALILGLVFGLIALVLLPLIVWKLVTWYMDSVEYTRFQQDQAKAKWSKTDNPMYEQPVQRHINPTYGRARAY